MLGKNWLKTSMYLHETLADPRRGGSGKIQQSVPISFISMQFSAKIFSKLGSWFKLKGWHPPSGKSWIRHSEPSTYVQTLTYFNIVIVTTYVSIFILKSSVLYVHVYELQGDGGALRLFKDVLAVGVWQVVVQIGRRRDFPLAQSVSAAAVDTGTGTCSVCPGSCQSASRSENRCRGRFWVYKWKKNPLWW